MRLAVIGLGICGTQQLSLEGRNRLLQSKKIGCLPIVPSTLCESLGELGIPPIEDLGTLYQDGDVDEVNYQRLFDKVIADCCKYENVALLVPGHPRIGVTLVQWLEARKQELQIELEVFPGISSFDTMINDLSRDPLERGSVLVDANRLLLFEYQIEPLLDYYIYHVCSIGTPRVYFKNASTENRLHILKKYLLRFYQPSKQVFLVTSPCEPQSNAQFFEARLEQMETLLDYVHFGTTLYIPSITPKQLNKEYLSILRGIS
ncbi:hypothetical protein LC608_31370 [Nostoc sp. XA010]|uniref:SAM-dependent methyltransferase n=1 Tax=Nostoc sp. XA010 TaxID=2780407 RepID=UPI001E394B15|nr:SAM-dependent methyltransferase [Nostoc sp. XA010]MCC5661376.1 hypothetical protein [Nostoc sp. XA010]